MTHTDIVAYCSLLLSLSSLGYIIRKDFIDVKERKLKKVSDIIVDIKEKKQTLTTDSKQDELNDFLSLTNNLVTEVNKSQIKDKKKAGILSSAEHLNSAAGNLLIKANFQTFFVKLDSLIEEFENKIK